MGENVGYVGERVGLAVNWSFVISLGQSDPVHVNDSAFSTSIIPN